MLRVEPELKAAYVANGTVSLSFVHVLDHGEASHIAHRAAECAGSQSPLAFWQMHDLLFTRQAQIWAATPEVLAGWAAELKLDGAAMTACLADPAIATKVERIDQARRTAGIRLRPSFTLNETLIEGALPFAGFVQRLAEQGINNVQ